MNLRAGLPSAFCMVHVMTTPRSFVFLRGQARFMRRRGVDLIGIASPGPELDDFACGEGVDVRAVRMTRRITPARDLVALIHLTAIFRRLKPDAVHAHTPKGGFLGIVAAWLARVPLRIYHIRGLPMVTARGWRRRVLRAVERLTCRLAHSVLCVSGSVREVAVGEALCDADKIRVLGAGSGNGVDAGNRFNPDAVPPSTRSAVRSRLSIPPDAVVAGFIGRIVREKGIEELMRAWEEVSSELPYLRLLVLGPFEDEDPVSPQTVAKLREHPGIHLVGLDWDTPQYYAAMDLVVLPTHREGFPNVPLEAAAMRLPVVATRIPGCVDAVADGVTGVLVPPGDAKALARTIRAYAMDPTLRERHGAAGRKRVLELFEQTAVWEALYQHYVSLVAEPRRGRRLSRRGSSVSRAVAPVSER